EAIAQHLAEPHTEADCFHTWTAREDHSQERVRVRVIISKHLLACVYDKREPWHVVGELHLTWREELGNEYNLFHPTTKTD
ncbi:MAG TPA: hypothetical protein VJG29_02380, partial [Candidatus Paceibacterota bacterium]